MGRKEPDYSKLRIGYAVQFRKTNTGMGSEFIQKFFADEKDAEAFFDQMRGVRTNVDIKLLRVVEIRVAETLKKSRMTEINIEK